MPANQPTTVQLADGTAYQIPSGDEGSYPWVRQAALIRDAYQQLGDGADAARWDQEYQQRNSAWNAAQLAGSWAAVLAQGAWDFILAPVRIVADLSGGVATIGQSALNLAKVLPLVAIGLVVVAGIAAYRGDLHKIVRR